MDNSNKRDKIQRQARSTPPRPARALTTRRPAAHLNEEAGTMAAMAINRILDMIEQAPTGTKARTATRDTPGNRLLHELMV